MTPESDDKFDEQAADIVALLVLVALIIAGGLCLVAYLAFR